MNKLAEYMYKYVYKIWHF